MSGDSSVTMVKNSLESWREVVLHADNILAWRQDWHPAVTAGTLTTVFTMLWYYDPSFLTMCCLAGLFATLADFLGPKIFPLVFGDSWDGAKEKQLERISQDLVHVNSLCRTCIGCYSAMRHLSHAPLCGDCCWTSGHLLARLPLHWVLPRLLPLHGCPHAARPSQRGPPQQVLQWTDQQGAGAHQGEEAGIEVS